MPDSNEYQPHELFIGLCRGGPLDRQQTESRFCGGFILVDKPNRLVWTYEYVIDSEFGDHFTCINDAGTAEAYDAEKVSSVANNSTFDVRAYDSYRGVLLPEGGGE